MSTRYNIEKKSLIYSFQKIVDELKYYSQIEIVVVQQIFYI
jgi:hypothetical protein